MAEQQGVVAKIGTDIDPCHSRRDEPRGKQGETELPEAIEHQMGGEANVGRRQQHFRLAENPSQREMIAEIHCPLPCPDLLLGLRRGHFSQSRKLKIVQVATDATYNSTSEFCN